MGAVDDCWESPFLPTHQQQHHKRLAVQWKLRRTVTCESEVTLGRWRGCRQRGRAGVRHEREAGAVLLFLDSCAGMLCGEAWDALGLKRADHLRSVHAPRHVGLVSTKTTPPKIWLSQREIKGWRQEKLRPEMSPEWWPGKGCVTWVWMSVFHLNS